MDKIVILLAIIAFSVGSFAAGYKWKDSDIRAEKLKAKNDSIFKAELDSTVQARVDSMIRYKVDYNILSNQSDSLVSNKK